MIRGDIFVGAILLAGDIVAATQLPNGMMFWIPIGLIIVGNTVYNIITRSH